MNAGAIIAAKVLRPLRSLSGDPFLRADFRIVRRRRSRPLAAQGPDGYQPSSTLSSSSWSCSSQAIQLAMRSSTAWPSHRVVSVDSQATEVYYMSSSKGKIWSSNFVTQ